VATPGVDESPPIAWKPRVSAAVRWFWRPTASPWATLRPWPLGGDHQHSKRQARRHLDDAAHPQMQPDSLALALPKRVGGLVYGGNRIGMMGVMADAARAARGRVVGVTPRMFIEHGHCDDACDELIVSTDMRDRKQILIARGDALVALPGGLGTLEKFLMR